MFKKLFLIAAITGSFFSSSAQGLTEVIEDIDPPTQTVLKPFALSIGPKIDFNYAIAGNPKGMDINLSGNAGFNAGVAANVRFGRPAGKPYGTERFGAQLELLYSMRNLKSDIKNITMNGFEIPVLFQWYFIPNLAVEIGPTFSGVFSASPKQFAVDNSNFEMSKLKDYDVMLTLGLNCMLKNGFMAEFRYNLGNSNMAGNFETKVSTISLGIGWLFNVIK